MGVHFTEADMKQLVEIYKNYDCLWNRKHESYRDNETRQEAYREIVEKLNIPNLTDKDIPKKIKNLRSSYYQEIKRIRRSVRLGVNYTPRVSWFKTVDGFLRPFKHERQFNSKRPIRGIKPVNKKDDSNKIQKENKQIDKTAERITPHPSLSTSNIKPEDEFDSFGKYIATSLRSMPQEFSIIAKTELQKAISDIQLKIVRQMNTGSDHLNLSQSPSGSASTSSDYENQHTGSPMSDTCISTIKIEYDN